MSKDVVLLVQGINRSYIFQKREDILYYIKQMYKIKEDVGVDIVAYCIMNNHAHILLNVEDTKIMSEYMHKLNTKYAVYYNRTHNRVGYVFRDRYRSEGIYNEQHLYNCIQYIYDNPVKAKICKKPWEYEYSNYKEYDKIKGENEIEEFIDVNIDDRELEKGRKEKQAREIIEKFLQKYKIKKEELRDNGEVLKELVAMIQNEVQMSMRWIGSELEIHREVIRKIMKK